MIEAVLAIEERRVILVDGFNVLHAVLLKEEREAGWWRRKQRERLLERVSSWPGRDDEIWVAFDGAEPSWSVWAEPVATIQSRGVRPGGAGENRAPGSLPTALPGTLPAAEFENGADDRGIVHVLHVESADDWIVRRARRTPHPERTVVVTADRQVAGRARSAGCEIWTPWAFMSRCRSRGPGSDVAVDPDDYGLENRALDRR